MFSTLSKTEIAIHITFILSSANAFNLDMVIFFSFWERVNPFPNKPWFLTCLQYKTLENTVGKGEIARYEQFLLFPRCFLPVSRTFCNFHQIWNCCLQSLSVWKILRFVVWERVIHFYEKWYQGSQHTHVVMYPNNHFSLSFFLYQDTKS